MTHSRFIPLSFIFVFVSLPFLVQAETIDLFQSQILLREDSSLDVTEWITYDFEENERHGIFRTIPLTHPRGASDPFHTRFIDIEITDVRMDQMEVPYEVSKDGDEIEIKIGDPEAMITGTHVYEIMYRVRGALEYLPDGSVDLYWNVTGHGWEVPIERVTARVPDPGHLYLDATACYVGGDGSTVPCEIETTPSFVDFYTEDLAPGEGLTIARAVDPAKVDQVILERLSLLIFWLVGAVLWLIGLAFFLYRHATANRTNRAIVAQYEPYKQLKPMYTGLLFDGRIDPHDITAGIVYLAERGFFKITRTERKKFLVFDVDDYEITLRRPYGELESHLQQKIFTLLFTEDAAIGDTVFLSTLAENAAKQKENFKIIHELNNAAAKDLIAVGFFEHLYRTMFKGIGVLGVILAAALLLTAYLGAELLSAIVIAAVTFVVSVILLAFTYRRRTRKGYEALDHLKGFKLFLSVAEKERYAFHNAPAKSPEQFMEYLPYAIAFGVEKEWAAVFNDIAIPQPEWYDGHGAAWSAVHLSNSLSAFSTTLASASGSSAASSGGGSSGGGAGGGGGGSW